MLVQMPENRQRKKSYLKTTRVGKRNVYFVNNLQLRRLEDTQESLAGLHSESSHPGSSQDTVYLIKKSSGLQRRR